MTAVLDRPPPDSPEGWSASLELVASLRGARTVLSRNRHLGPLRVQRPFYPEGGICHVYVLHPPGGLVAGDSLDISVRCEPNSQVLLTSPSASRVYCSNQQRLRQSQKVSIDVATSARCEWLPQESIVFDSAEGLNQLSISLADGAEFSGWEITCLGRPASEDFFEGGQLQQNWEIVREGRPLLLERTKFVGGSAQLQAPSGLGGATVTGTFITTCLDAPIEDIREAIAHLTASETSEAQGQRPSFVVPLVAVTALPELLVIRALGQNAADIKAIFIALWHLLRKAQSGQTAVAPRIWFS